MYSYIKGVITIIETNYVVLENNGIGYLIYVSNPYSYKIGDDVTIYLYQQIKEDEHLLFGFKSKEEKDLFLKLISVKGLGPKMVLPMLSGDNMNNIYASIEEGNINYLKKFPKIGDKVARQIILDLKGKLAASINTSELVSTMDELVEVLKGLGYKMPDIKKILPHIDRSKTIEEQIKEALRLMLK